jgi:hypothetical protein
MLMNPITSAQVPMLGRRPELVVSCAVVEYVGRQGFGGGPVAAEPPAVDGAHGDRRDFGPVLSKY